MVKTPWSALAAALVMSLGLAACDSGGEEAPESNVSGTNANAQPAQSTQDGTTEAGENTAGMAEQAGNDSDAAGDPAAGDLRQARTVASKPTTRVVMVSIRVSISITIGRAPRRTSIVP
jgi:hypothetical protein